MPAGWWTRRSNYFWYIVREFTSLPLALWLLWFLVEIQRAQNGPKNYYPHSSTGFVIFSVIVLLFALYHSVTFLSLSGVDPSLQGHGQGDTCTPDRDGAVRPLAGRVRGDHLRAGVLRPMSEHARRPALAHLFWWFMFAQGGVIAAILIPAHVLVQGILGPLKVVPVVDRNYDTWISILGNPIVKLYLLVLIAFPFFHFAHRLRYLLVDLGVPAAKSVPAQAIFYGGAVVVTLFTIWLLLTTAPISLG